MGQYVGTSKEKQNVQKPPLYFKWKDIKRTQNYREELGGKKKLMEGKKIPGMKNKHRMPYRGGEGGMEEKGKRKW